MLVDGVTINDGKDCRGFCATPIRVQKRIASVKAVEAIRPVAIMVNQSSRAAVVAQVGQCRRKIELCYIQSAAMLFGA
jgi:hypothetical protein